MSFEIPLNFTSKIKKKIISIFEPMNFFMYMYTLLHTFFKDDDRREKLHVQNL